MHSRGPLLALMIGAVTLAGSGCADSDGSTARASDLPTTVLDTVAPTSPQTTSTPTTATTTTTSTTTTATTTTAPPGRTGVFLSAPGGSEQVGTGRLVTYSVAVEESLGLDPATVAAEVDRALSDPRSWTADGSTAFRRVAQGAAVEIIVASPATVDSRCLPLNTAGTYSCRSGGSVNINADRWMGATQDWSADLTAYRDYVVNHEVGHFLGHGHLSCPGPGELAPLMMQQSKGLDGCLANPWPFP